MHVGIAIQNNYPVDNEVRTRKIAKSLDRDGNDVSIFARNAKHHPAQGRVRETYDPREEDIGYARVRRFSVGISTPLYRVLSLPLPFNPVWFLWMVLAFRREDPDVVVATNIRAGPPAIVAARLLGIPIIIDLRENFPELAKVLPTGGTLDAVAQDPRLVRLLERFVVAYADQVWVVVEERRDELVAAGVDASKLTVVSNTPDLSEIAAADRVPADGTAVDGLEPGDESPFTLVYVGAVSEFRGLDRMIEAMPRVLEADEDVRLVIGGDGPHRSALERHSRELGVQDSVEFLGWVDSEAVPAVLDACDAGIVLHEANGFTDTTIPNKLFDYMAVGLPVLATDLRPVARVVERTNCGRVVSRDPSPQEIGDAVLELKRSDVRSLGENGRRAVTSRYNWDREAERIADALRQFEKRGRDERVPNRARGVNR